MDLLELINRDRTPVPWAEGDNIPWHEPGFSGRMLREHLSQAHDAASRRFDIIDRQVEWIHRAVLNGRPSTVLDLGCGPGFYSERLARLGHTSYGIDYSPASIEYAIATAERDHLDCHFLHQDIRLAEYHQGVDLAMLIFGELNVFRPADARKILEKAFVALAPGGRLLLEPHTYSKVKELGTQPASWYSSKGGLFFDGPHLVFHDYSWDEKAQAATIRYYVQEAASGTIQRYAQSMQAYRKSQYRSLLASLGYKKVEFLPGLSPTDTFEGLIVIEAHK